MGPVGVAAAVATGALVLLTWLRRRLLVVTIEGHSMGPTDADGDVVLVERLRPPTSGQVVVVERPEIAGQRRQPDYPAGDG
jgi:signal peptidase I